MPLLRIEPFLPLFKKEEPNMKQAPKFPFALRTSLSVITEKTSVEEAQKVIGELEVLYRHHFRDEPMASPWSLNDIHELDRAALIELHEIVRAASAPPLRTELICQFQTERWKQSHQDMFNLVMEVLNKGGSGCEESAVDPAPVPGA